MDTNKDIERVNAEAMASQVLLIGLMNAMVKRGLPIATIDEAFEFAASVAIVAGDKLKSKRPTLMLAIVDRLRKSIRLPPDGRSG